MKRILKALILVFALSVVLSAFAACEIEQEKTTLTTPEIASKVYTGSKLTADVPQNEGYKVDVNEGGTEVGEYKVVLSLSDETKYEWATPDSDDATKVSLTFAVTKASNEITSLTIEDWTFGETAKTPVATAKFGTPTYTYGTSAEGDFTETIPTSVGNYFVKASVAATDNYDAAEKTVAFKIARGTSTITSAPQAVANLVYNGQAQVLVTAGTANGGTLQYKLGADGVWSSELPTATNADEYTVYYKVLGDDDHTDVIVEEGITVTIAKVNATLTTAPVAVSNLVYSGETLTLVVGGVATNGTMKYKLGDGDWTEAIPTATNAGEYTVWYMVEPLDSANYNGIEQQSLTVAVAKATNEITSLTIEGWTYGEAAKTPVATAQFGTAAFTYGTSADGDFTETAPTAAGNYFVKATVAATDNFLAADKTATFTIAKAAAQVAAPTAKEGLVYDGTAKELVNAGTVTSGATIAYKLDGGDYSVNLPTATNAGEYKVYYKFTAQDNYTVDEKECQLTVTVAKAQDNVEFSLEGVEVHCGDDLPELTATSTSKTAVTFTYSIDGNNFVSESDLEKIGFAFEDGNTYYFKASVAESNNYLAAEVTRSLTATHQFRTTESDGISTVACVCGTKTVSGTLATKQTIDLDAAVIDGVGKAQDGTLDLTAIGFAGKGTVNFTIGEASYQANATDGVVNLGGVLPLSIYGEQTIAVKLTDGKANYNVTINALVITKTIKTTEDYAGWIAIAKACEQESNLWGGYFCLGNNISATDMATFNRGETDGTEGFKGLFDGKGYAIDGLTRTANNTNAFVTTMTSEGALKNIYFTNVKLLKAGNFLCSGGKGTIENVFVQYSEISEGDANGYNATIANMQDGCALRNIFVDASNAKISGSGAKFRILTSGTASGFGGVFGICPSTGYDPQQALGGRGNNYQAIAYFASLAELKANADTQSVIAAWDGKFWTVNDGIPAPSGFVANNLALSALDFDLDISVVGGIATLNDGELEIDCMAVGFTFGKVVSAKMDGVILDANKFNYVDGKLLVKRSAFGFNYGAKQVAVTDENGKTITMDVTLVSKVIKTTDDYVNWIAIARACEENNQLLGGYFKLGANITSSTMVTFDRYDVDGEYGFKGVFDGCGYAIDGLTATGYAFMSCMTKDGVLKNIAFTGVTIAGEGNFLCSGGLGTFENIYVQYASITAGSAYNGTIFNHCRNGEDAGKITNVFIDASQAVISGSGNSFRLLGGSNNGYNGMFAVCPDGYTVKEARDTNTFADHAVIAFANYDELKANVTTQTVLKTWDSTYWTITDGVPVFNVK